MRSSKAAYVESTSQYLIKIVYGQAQGKHTIPCVNYWAILNGCAAMILLNFDSVSYK